MKFYPTRAFALALVLATPMTAFATNGMFMIGNGIKSVGMGGVGIAAPFDSMAGMTNPAGIAEVGTRFDLEATLFKFNVEASLGGLNAKSRFNTFIMPGLGFSMPVDNETTFGFSMGPAGGGGSHYRQNLYNLKLNPAPGAAVFGDLGVELMIMQMNPTMAQKLTPNQMVGVSVVMGLQRFKAFGLGNFETFTTTQTTNTPYTNRGVEYSRGLGMRFGWLGKFFGNKLNLGAAVTSKTYMSKFQNYSELFAEGGDIDTPANIGAGIALKPNPKLTVAMDITRTYYSKVKAIANRGPNATGGVYPEGRDTNSLGKDGGLGFGWKDQTVYKLGVNYEYSNKWTWRTGWNYGKSPIDESREIIFNIVAPGVTQHHFTFGGTYKINREMETSFAYMHAFEFEQSGPTYIASPGVIKMSQNSLGASLSFAF